MDDKDLKKLSRLELLELLLEESRENEELNSELLKIREAAAEDSREIRALSEKVNSVEKNVAEIRDILSKERFTTERSTIIPEDALLLNSLLEFYKSHMYLINVFPKALKDKLLTKIKRS
ncbi:MAG: hypothetical protein IJB86_04020 [Clostridia bacterium]|nr:hypothetical protein [Clostridia bacterium]